MIEITGLVKEYGAFRAVDNLSFSIGGNKVYGFLGPNGAGKSTTMNIITGYISATAGTVTVDGYDIFLQPEQAKSRIGYLPEIPPVYPDMTPREYLRFAAKLKKVEKKAVLAEVGRVMELTDIQSMQNRLIKNLSKGYRQRVGVACMLLGSPQYIILDEPTAGLDPKQIIDILDLIRELGKEHTVILSSHILPEISAVCDNVLILDHGKLVVNDSLENLSRLMQESNLYDLKVKGTAQQTEQALCKLTGVKNMSVGKSADGIVAVHLETDREYDAREDIFRALAKADCPLIEINTETVGLEDIFLRLTNGGASAQLPKTGIRRKQNDRSL